MIPYLSFHQDLPQTIAVLAGRFHPAAGYPVQLPPSHPVLQVASGARRARRLRSRRSLSRGTIWRA